MSLVTAHKILISTATVFFFGLALWEVRNYLSTENLWALVRSFLYVSASVGFGIYLRSLKHWLK